MMKKILLAVLILGFLTGCASTKQVWWKPDFNELQYQKDLYECTLVSRKIGSIYNLGSPLSALIEQRRLCNQCMRAKGYEVRGVPQ